MQVNSYNQDITQFRDEYRWLSNFWFFERPMVYDNIVYSSVEHFYVAMKSRSNEFRRQVAATHKPSEVKRLGKSVDLREDWDKIKLDVMLYAVRYKFSTNNLNLRKKLLATAGRHLSEGNWHKDSFWGVYLKDGVGENNLGRILMMVRDEIILSQKIR